MDTCTRECRDISIYLTASLQIAVNVSHVAAHRPTPQASLCMCGGNMLNKTHCPSGECTSESSDGEICAD